MENEPLKDQLSDNKGLVNSSSSSAGMRSATMTSSATAATTTTTATPGYGYAYTQHQQLIPYVLNHHQALHVHHGHINGPHHLSFERKCLLAATSATVIGLILMLVAVSTDYWLIVTNPGGAYFSQDKLWRMASHSGIWRICNIDFRNETPPFRIDTQCQRHILFPSEREATNLKHEFDQTSLDYTRSEVAFSTMAIILMLIGQGFAFYSFKERRYMFKRITALLHILSAVCVLICIEVLVSSVTYEQAHLPFRHPAQSVSHFGFSFVLACVTCAAFLIAGIVFGVFSRKRKAEKAMREMKALSDQDVEQEQSMLANVAPLAP